MLTLTKNATIYVVFLRQWICTRMTEHEKTIVALRADTLSALFKTTTRSVTGLRHILLKINLLSQSTNPLFLGCILSNQTISTVHFS